MTTTAIKLSGARAAWLVAVTSLIMEGGGDQPPSRGTLYRRAPKLVGPTAVNDGHVTAALNGLDRNDTLAGQRLFVDFWLAELRHVGWVEGDDDAIRWTGPLTGDMKITPRGERAAFSVLAPGEAGAAKDEAKVADVLAGRGHLNPVRYMNKQGEPARGPKGELLKNLKVHPLALTIPQMTGAEIEQLRKDVQAHGIREPLTLFEGMVLDGRHRLYMASEYDLPVHLKEFDGDEAAARAYVFSANVVRRHLTAAQKVLAVKELFMPEAERRAKEAKKEGSGTRSEPGAGYRRDAVTSPAENGSDRGKTAAQIASELSGDIVSPRAIETMNNVDPVETPETVEAIKTGEITGQKAARTAAAKERGKPAPDLPEDRSARKLIGEARHFANRTLSALGEPSQGGAKAGEIREIAIETRAILAKIIDLTAKKTGPA